MCSWPGCYGGALCPQQSAPATHTVLARHTPDAKSIAGPRGQPYPLQPLNLSASLSVSSARGWVLPDVEVHFSGITSAVVRWLLLSTQCPRELSHCCEGVPSFFIAALYSIRWTCHKWCLHSLAGEHLGSPGVWLLFKKSCYGDSCQGIC